MSPPRTPSIGRGVLYGVAAYGTWALAPIYWKQLHTVPAPEIVAHRVIWGLLVLIAMLAARQRLPEMRTALISRTIVVRSMLSALLLSANWVTFIYAVTTDRVMQASLGYFINPLFSVALGRLFLREHIRPLGWVAIVLAAFGVSQFWRSSNGVPWLALILASTFGLYGLIRKTTRVAPLPGTATEAAVLLPVAIGYLCWLQFQGQAHFAEADPLTMMLILGMGPLTACPLVWFAAAARSLPLTLLGFLQYLAPTGQFLLALVLYREPVTSIEIVGFACIWLALSLFTIDSVRTSRRARLQR